MTEAMQTLADIADSYSGFPDPAQNITVPVRLADIRAAVSEARELAAPEES